MGFDPGKARASKMASIEFITKRIEGKQKEITKLENKLARIEKAQATNWEVNPYYYGEDDLRWTLKDLSTARVALEEYQKQLTAETEKANSRNVPAILEFLDNWKAHVTEYYHERFTKFLAEREIRHAENAKYCEFVNTGWFKMEDREAARVAVKEAREAETKARRAYEKKWNFIFRYVGYGAEFDDELLAKDLQKEADAKYDDIIERVNFICGKITDARGLWIGNKGDLDGIIVGERGTAKVQTIGAGGYNIQCYHFRTLVHEMK